MINPFSSQKHFLCSDVFVRRGQERPNNKTRYFIILCILLFDCLLYTCVADDAGETELRGLQTNLAKLYGFAPENIADVSLTSIKQILEAPPEIKDATFVEFHGAYRKSNFSQALFSATNYYRCGWATNGYVLSIGLDESELNTLTAMGDTMGRFGYTNWHASGSAILFEDSLTDTKTVVGKDRSSLALKPLKLGILPLTVGSVNFSDDTRFTAKDFQGKSMKGQFITRNPQTISGIKYETEGVTNYIYVVIFFRPTKDDSSNVAFPANCWATYSVGDGNTNLAGMTRISHIDVTREALPNDFFYPSRWIAQTSSIPIVKAYAFSNQLMIPMSNGKLISAGSLEKFTTTSDPSRRRIVLVILLMVALLPPVLFVIWQFREKISRNNKQQK